MIDVENLCEIFNSFQGEGFDVGEPMTFIRFNLCNKECSFCDTDFRKKFEGKIEVDDWLDTVCFTGGEPMLFKEDILNVCRKVKGKRFCGETNGSVFDSELAKIVDWAVSPKSLEDTFVGFRLVTSNPNSFLKFVYKSFDGFEEAVSMAVDVLGKDRVCIQPRTDKNNMFVDIKDCLNFCLKNGLRYSCRLHLVMDWR
jgi:organic radical activating enzyme